MQTVTWNEEPATNVNVAKSERSEGQVRVDKWSRVFSIIALVVSLLTAAASGVWSVAVGQSEAAREGISICLDWASFVRAEQGDDRWQGVDPAVVDARIDRLGAVAVVQDSTVVGVCGSAEEYRAAWNGTARVR